MSEQLEAIIENCGYYMTAPRLGRTTMRRLMTGLEDRYSEPWRYHHVVAHMCDVMQFIVDNIDEVEEPRALLWGGGYHDSVLVPQAIIPGANEELSTQLAQHDLAPYLSNQELVLVGKHIRGTIDHRAEPGSDLAYLLDGDLKIFGAPRDEFDAYDANIRLEYDFVDPETYNTKRGEILADFYDRSKANKIYLTDIGQLRYAKTAQANLEYAVSKYPAPTN